MNAPQPRWPSLAGAAVLAIAALWALRAVLPVIVLSVVFAVLTWPLVHALERRMPRLLAIAIVDLGIAATVAAAGVLAFPSLAAQAQSFVASIAPALQSILHRLPAPVQLQLAAALSEFNAGILSYAREALSATFRIVQSVAAIAAAIVVVPVLAAYLQLDAPRYASALYLLLPREQHARARAAIEEISVVVGGFARGQVLVSSIVAVLVYGVLKLCGIPYAGIIAIVTGLTDLVPYLGGAAAFLPSLLFAAANFGAGRAALVFVLLLAVFELEAQVLSPQIVGSRTQLPPSAIMIALLAGGALFGVMGLYLAVPFTAAVVAGARGYVRQSPRRIA